MDRPYYRRVELEALATSDPLILNYPLNYSPFLPAIVISAGQSRNPIPSTTSHFIALNATHKIPVPSMEYIFAVSERVACLRALNASLAHNGVLKRHVEAMRTPYAVLPCVEPSDQPHHGQ